MYDAQKVTVYNGWQLERHVFIINIYTDTPNHIHHRCGITEINFAL